MSDTRNRKKGQNTIVVIVTVFGRTYTDNYLYVRVKTTHVYFLILTPQSPIHIHVVDIKLCSTTHPEKRD